MSALPAPGGRRIALVLQGGGALGAYQAGAYAGLAAAGYRPDWVVGVSIGAVNGAIIAGNPPERRLDALREWWSLVSERCATPMVEWPGAMRDVANAWSAAGVVATGVNGFFTPRVPPPVLLPPGGPEAWSWYDTTPLHATLERLVDFDLLNDGPVRYAAATTEVETGNFVYFDTSTTRVGPEHVMASGALPPSLPAVIIGDKAYWDGGLVSNSPLNYIYDDRPRQDTLAFQVDLFPARGPRPIDLSSSAAREKDIRFSSRTRLGTTMVKEQQQLRAALATVLDALPEALRDTPAAKLLAAEACPEKITIAHLIYRDSPAGAFHKDYEFSRPTITMHWECGLRDANRLLDAPARMAGDDDEAAVTIYDAA